MNILVIGDLILDKFSLGKVTRISPENHSQVFNIKENKFSLGGSGNVAANFQKLGNNVTLIGKIANDQSGKILERILKKKKINHFLIKKKLYKTCTKTRYTTKYGQLLRVDNEQIENLDNSEIKKIINYINKVRDLEAIYVSDYDKGFCNKKIINHLKLKFKKAVFFADPKTKKIDFFTKFDFLKPNLNYLNSFFDKKIKNNELSQYCKILRKKNSIKNIIVTMSHKGAFYSGNGGEIKITPDNKIDVFDVTGAGDIFGTFFLHSYIINHDFKEALKIASKASEKSIQMNGTVDLCMEDLYDKSIYYFSKHNQEIKKYVKKWNGQKIGFANGCFDLLHPGHLNLLKASKKKVDKLIIGLNSDKSVKKLKGADRPIINELDRANMLKSINYVDMVIIFNELTPEKLIKFLKPKYLFKGNEYKNKKIVGEKILKNHSGKVVLIPMFKKHSTSFYAKKK